MAYYYQKSNDEGDIGIYSARSMQAVRLTARPGFQYFAKRVATRCTLNISRRQIPEKQFDVKLRRWEESLEKFLKSVDPLHTQFGRKAKARSEPKAQSGMAAMWVSGPGSIQSICYILSFRLPCPVKLP